MQLSIRDRLPFVSVTIEYAGRRAEITNVLVDTGSGRTVLGADLVASVGIEPSANDVIRKMHGMALSLSTRVA